MKSFVVSVLSLGVLTASAQASIQAFSCKVVVLEPGKTYSCEVSVDPSDDSTQNLPKSGEIDTTRFAGSFSVNCPEAGDSPLNQKLAIYDEHDSSADDITGLKQELTDSSLTQYGQFAVTPDQVSSMHQYDAAIGGSVFEYVVGETLNASGAVSGHIVSFSNGLMIGCLK